MNNSGDAAEQIVRMTLEGTEVALRLSGSAAKNIAVALYTVAKDSGKNQTKGQQKLNAMLKSGKELKVFTVGENDLARFASESKRYGVVYCVLQPKGKSPDGNVDILVRAEDAAKINRIVERFKLSAVDTVSIKHDIEQHRAERAAETKDPVDLLVDDMMRDPKQKDTHENPTMARTAKRPPSEPISKGRENADGRSDLSARPSVREELQRIKAEQAKRAKTQQRQAPAKEKQQQSVAHKQLKSKKKKHKQKGR